MTIVKFLKNIGNNWIFLVLILSAIFLRFYFLDKFVSTSGDLLLYADWGEKYWEYGSKNFYFVKDWYYAPPNYPPLVNLYYAYAYKAFDYKYLFAQLHNVIRIPPAVFIIYYYKWGYFINLKMLAIISDILIGVVIYKEGLRLLKKKKLAILASSLYLFNPTTIILSSVWGQTDSVIALLSIVSFILLARQKFILSSLLFSVGLLFKPNWIVFVPLYCFIFLMKRPKISQVVLSFLTVIAFMIICVLPFSNNPVSFYTWLIGSRIAPTIGASSVASVSAFNFYTTFLRLDYDLSSYRIFIIPVKFIGQLVFFTIYALSIFILLKKRAMDADIYKALIVLGLGSFLFMPGMLERYFFPAVIPFAILAVNNRKLLILYIVFALTLGLNVIWALFRRKYGILDDIFTKNNFLLIRIISLYNVAGFIMLIRTLFKDNLLKLSLWKK